MNGATEATLAELLRVAQEQNVNLSRLNSLLSRGAGGGSGGGSGGGGGVGGLLSSIPLVSTAFDVLKGAASMVGSAFEMVGSIIGKLVSGITDTIGNLFKFSLMAADGTAKLSDLYAAFKDLPFGLGLIAQGFSSLLKVLEKAVVEFQAMANAGATFTGSITELRVRAAMVGMTLQEFSKTVQTNSELFANFGGTVQSGVNRFTMAMNSFRPGGQFANTINSLGLTTADAAEYMVTMMKVQQGLTKNGQVDSASLSKMTKDYIVELDGLSKLTGIHRDQINESVKRAADDQVWMTFIDSLNPEERAAKMEALAMAEATMGKEYADTVVKAQLRGIDAPLNAAAEKMAVASGGASVQIGAALRRISESGMSAAEKSKAMIAEFAKVGIATNKFTVGLGKEMQAVAGEMIPQGVLKFGRALGAAGNDVDAYQAKMRAEQEALKNSPAGQLIAAQEKIKSFGNDITILMSRLAEMLLPTLINWGDKVLNWMGRMANEYGPKLIDWINQAVVMFEKYVVPKLQKIATWFGETWDALVSAKTSKEFFEKLGERFKDGVNNIWDDLKKLWKAVEPTFLEIWNKDVKPVIVRLWTEILNYMKDAIKTMLFGPKQQSGEGATNYTRQDDINQQAMNWWQTGVVKYQEANEYLLGLISKDAAERVKNQRVIDQKQYLIEQGQLPRPITGGRALGGSVSPGTYLVGERGPELASVGSDGSIITNENLQQLLNRMANNQDNKNLVSLMEALNNNMKQLNGYAKDTAEYTRRTVSEISGLSPNMLPTI